MPLVDLGPAPKKGLVDLGPALIDLGPAPQQQVQTDIPIPEMIIPEQPFDPSEAPGARESAPAQFGAPFASRMLMAMGRAAGIPTDTLAELQPGAKAPVEKIRKLPWYKKFPEATGWTAATVAELTLMHMALTKAGFLMKLPKSATVLDKAVETAKWFGAMSVSRQARKAPFGGTAEALPVLRDAAIGAAFSFAISGVSGIWNKLRPDEQMRALKTLGLKHGATPEQIKKASWKLAHKTHPDKVKGMRAEFDEMMKAREVAMKGPPKDIVYRGKAPAGAKLLPGAQVPATQPVRPAVAPVSARPAKAPIIPPKAPQPIVEPPAKMAVRPKAEIAPLPDVEEIIKLTPESPELEKVIADISQRIDVAFKQDDLDTMREIVQLTWELPKTSEADALRRRAQILDGEMLARARKRQAHPPTAKEPAKPKETEEYFVNLLLDEKKRILEEAKEHKGAMLYGKQRVTEIAPARDYQKRLKEINQDLKSRGYTPQGKPIKGAPSKVGFPGIEPTELPAEPVAREPVSARQIIEHLSKALKVPYRSMATHRPRVAKGLYFIREAGIRQINVRDLNTAAHEVGHHIDYFYNIRQKGISKAGRKTWKMPKGTAKGTAAEMTKLGKALYGTRKPVSGYRAEGIAEFIRGYLTGEFDVKKEAPNFYRWFTKDYLPNNPEIDNALKKAQELLTDYRLQGAEARIEGQISRKEIKGALRDRAKRLNLWFRTMFLDEFAPLKKEMELAGVPKLKPTEDPYELAVYYSQKEGARARQMVLNGTIDLWGNVTGKGLKEIMTPIVKQNAVREFTRFVVSARSLDLWKRGINPGIPKSDAKYIYELYKDNEGWTETAKEITDWNHRVLDYLVEAGAIQKELADKMKELNPIYVPFMRSFAKGEKRFGGGGAGKGLITTKKGVFAIKGSGREIIDPFESMIIQTRRMISIAHKHMIARALANLEAKHRGLAGLIWEVPAPKRAMTFQAEQVKKQLMEMGVEFPEAGLEKMDALLTVYGNSPIYLGKENILCIIKEGKRKFYEVSPEMYRLLQGLDKFYLRREIDLVLGKPGRAVRLGATGINAAFGLVRNPIRDSLDTIFKGTHARGPLASVKGVAKDLSRLGLAKSLGIEPSKAAKEFIAMGGQITGFIGQDRKSLQHVRGEMLASTVGKYAIHTVKHPIDALRGVFGVAESGPRIEEYEKALQLAEKKYGKDSPEAKVYAFNKAQDQTINYSRHGVIGKWLNQMIPFWNANAQDPSKVYRTFKNRGKEATAYATAFLTLPALGLWWLNKDEEWYKELPAYETANYVHIKLPGEDRILRLPVPFLVGHIFMSTPVVMMDALYRADPERIKEHFEHVLKGDVYPLSEWPAAVGPIIDVLQNKDWADRPIIPKGLEGKLPSDQYKEYTTEFCKTIAKVLNAALPRGKEISPLQIEYMINAYSGGLYRRTERVAGMITKAPEARQLADLPVIGAIIVRDPYAPRRSIERFYNEREHLNRMYQSDKIEAGSDLDRKRKRYDYIGTKFLSPYWKKLQKAKTVRERKKIYGKIGALIKKVNK